MSGEADFSHLGDLLDFTPVPRKTQRVDGWSADKQRAFIAALAATGSKRRAAQSLGMAAFGIDQILKSDGNDSFKAAYERAMAIARQNGTIKIASGIADAAARNAQLTPPSRLRGHVPEPEPTVTEDEKLDALESIWRKYHLKVRAEREARLAGQVVAADFYLRQLTFIEVGLDLAAADLEMSGFELMQSFQREGHNWLQIAETPMSRLLDEERRRVWAEAGEPERPEHPPRFFLMDRGSFSLEAGENEFGALTRPAAGVPKERWATMNTDEQRAARKADLAASAAMQIAWEAKAHQEYYERRDSDASE